MKTSALSLFVFWMSFFTLPLAHAGQVSLAWDPCTQPVLGYRVYYGTSSGNYTGYIDVGNQTTAVITGLAEGQTFYFAAMDYDSTEQSGFSNEVSYTIPVPAGDTTPPSVVISSPAANSTVSGTVTLGVTAADDVGVAGVQFKIDGNNYGPPLTSAPFTISLNTTQLPDGVHSLSATAWDAAGNSADAPAISMIVNNSTADTQAPVAQLTSPANGSTVPKGQPTTISASASDNVGVTHVDFYVNNTLTCSDSTPAYTCTWNVPKASGKSYKLQVKAYDAAGLVGSSAIVTVKASK